LLGLILGSSTSPCFSRSSDRGTENQGCLLNSSHLHLYVNGTDPRQRTEKRIIPNTGNRNFDLALAVTLSKLSQLLQVRPAFFFYDDNESANALATTAKIIESSEGTVLFGRQLFKELMTEMESAEIAVAAVSAHEFGHILQFKRGLLPRVSPGRRVRRAELQADVFAGYFAGYRKVENPSLPAAVFATTVQRVGDYDTSHDHHHGTPEDRAAAVVKGFKCAYEDRMALDQVISESIRYVTAV
jgi:hypothetical protein